MAMIGGDDRAHGDTVGEITSELASLEDKLTILNDKIWRLEEALAQVLMPDNRDGEERLKTQSMDTEIGNRIYDANQNLSDAISRLDSIKSRVGI